MKFPTGLFIKLYNLFVRCFVKYKCSNGGTMSKVGKLYKDRSGYICGNINSLTSKEIDELIDSILEAKAEIVEREKKEKEMEEAKKEEERKKLLEEKKIEELTNMELPLDWSNMFDFDSDASSIHVETAGDGLIYSLKNKLIHLLPSQHECSMHHYQNQTY